MGNALQVIKNALQQVSEIAENQQTAEIMAIVIWTIHWKVAIRGIIFIVDAV